MSNRPKIDLAKLAEQLTGAKASRTPAAPGRPRSAFPRIPVERFEQLLDGDGQADDEATASADASRFRVRALLDGQAAPAIHYQGRPR